VRLSHHVIRQALVSEAVAAQYIPFAGELDPTGHEITFDGHFKMGLLEQMYQNRVIFLLDMHCPVYCRFCFRKHKNLRQEKSPCVADVLKAVDRVRSLPKVKEVLITGGEPLLNRANIEAALDGLMEIDHVKSLRIATRSISYYPELFLKNNRRYIQYLKEKQAACIKKGKLIEIGVHFVHPDEVSLQSLDIISDLVRSGIPVYVQTPFLNGLNTRGEVLGNLFTLLRNAGAEIYYIFTPCHPIHGTKKYWTSISQAFEAHGYLRANLSDRCIPKLCTATPLGKMEWNTSGWAVAEDESDPSHTWIRTPYTRDYFKAVTKDNNPLNGTRENKDKTLNVKCLIDMGDKNLFLGGHSLVGTITEKRTGRPDKLPSPGKMLELKGIQNNLISSGSLLPSIFKTSFQSIARVHKTRVEVNLSNKNPGIAYIRDNPEITDVVLHVGDEGGSEAVILNQLERITWITRQLGRMDHIVCVRIRWQAFQYHSKAFTRDIIDRIAGLARFSIADPLRVEIETWWFIPEEVSPVHGWLARQVAFQGIQVYANLSLISGMNDDPGTIARMAQVLREAGIGFHHVYVAGLETQKVFNRERPIETDQVLAIASHVRKVCSGREIPLYMIQTPLGEVDFGLTSSLVRPKNTGKDEKWFLRLDPYDLDYFLAMDPDFVLPETVERVEGALMVELTGLVRPGDFPV